MSSSRVVQKMVGQAGKTAERARYVELTRQGLNNSEICRILGIGRKTGSKWRNGWTVRDPKTGGYGSLKWPHFRPGENTSIRRSCRLVSQCYQLGFCPKTNVSRSLIW